MDFPKFFSWDNFNDYIDGPLPSPDRSVCWLEAGNTTQGLIVAPRDNFNEYADGALPSPDKGQGWLEAGSTTVY